MLRTMAQIPSLLDWKHVFPITLLKKRELKALDTVVEVSRESLSPHAARHYETGEIPLESYRALADAGLLALIVPKKYGGRGLSYLAYTAAMLELGGANVEVTSPLNMLNVELWFLNELADDHQKSYFFDRVVNYGELFAASTSEPGIDWTDSHGTVLHTTVKQLPEGNYVLNGEKWRTSMARSAAFYCVAAVMRGRSTKEGLVLAIVPSDTPGVTVIEDWNLPMMRATDSCSVRFTDCIIPASHIVGKPGELPKKGLFPLFALGYASFYLGMGLSSFLSFVEEFGDQVSDEILGNMALDLRHALCVLSYAATAWQTADKRTIPIATADAKAFCPEVARRILTQINTFIDNEDYKRLLDESRAAQYMPPSPALVASRIGNALQTGTEPRFLGFRGD